jgi:hypothetical protein
MMKYNKQVMFWKMMATNVVGDRRDLRRMPAPNRWSTTTCFFAYGMDLLSPIDRQQDTICILMTWKIIQQVGYMRWRDTEEGLGTKGWKFVHKSLHNNDHSAGSTMRDKAELSCHAKWVVCNTLHLATSPVIASQKLWHVGWTSVSVLERLNA